MTAFVLGFVLSLLLQTVLGDHHRWTSKGLPAATRALHAA